MLLLKFTAVQITMFRLFVSTTIVIHEAAFIHRFSEPQQQHSPLQNKIPYI